MDVICSRAMDRFFKRLRTEASADGLSGSASDYELQPPPRKTPALMSDSSQSSTSC